MKVKEGDVVLFPGNINIRDDIGYVHNNNIFKGKKMYIQLRNEYTDYRNGPYIESHNTKRINKGLKQKEAFIIFHWEV